MRVRESDRWGGGRDDESEGPIQPELYSMWHFLQSRVDGMKGVSIYLIHDQRR